MTSPATSGHPCWQRSIRSRYSLLGCPSYRTSRQQLILTYFRSRLVQKVNLTSHGFLNRCSFGRHLGPPWPVSEGIPQLRPGPKIPRCPQICPANYAPVCGSNGQTYSNNCGLRVAACEDPTITKASDGECPSTNPNCPQFCPANYAPVCGSNGQTYGNDCELGVAACGDPTITKASDGECGGVVKPECPQICPFIYDPVCGSNGQTYGNDCQLGIAACEDPTISKVSDGQCYFNKNPLHQKSDKTIKKIKKIMSPTTLFLYLSSLLWASNAQTEVQRHFNFPPGGGVCNRNCPRNIDPVCGTNGQTYQNFCLLLVARRCDNIRVRKRHDGECGATNPNCRPSTFCPFNYAPICGSDGNTYANECAFRNAACNNPRLTKVSDGECGGGRNPLCKQTLFCPSIYQPVCGNNGQTYDNECVFSNAACTIPTLRKASDGACGSRPNCNDICPAVFAPVCGSDGRTYENECRLNAAACRNPSLRKVANGNCGSRPNCPEVCPANYDPICGTDGITYGNQCNLGVATCKNPSIQKAHNGECGSVRPPIVVCPQGCPFNFSPSAGVMVYVSQSVHSGECILQKLFNSEIV
ncbi:serine protease inhibitor dipetalogastin-like [Macrobrachium nipponense]|uniref:serine protease inhibitor dipetalogastin-like n=1 Tax=Macrobrachium nipponense TaxID=159736 RepID=UPI0030C7E2FC